MDTDYDVNYIEYNLWQIYSAIGNVDTEIENETVHAMCSALKEQLYAIEKYIQEKEF